MWVQIRTKLANHELLVRLFRLYKRLRVVRYSPYENIYYCCTPKTASQWSKAIFSDPIVYKYTGLQVFSLTLGAYSSSQSGVRLQDVRFDGPLPRHTIGTHLYIGYPAYLTIPKPVKYKTFFVLRDPRDIVVSWYFSVRYSHSPMGRILKRRNELEKLTLGEGLRYGIDKLEEAGVFWVQRSWMHISEDRQDFKIFRYEDLACDNRSFLKQLFDYLNIVMPEKQFLTLYDRHKFEKYSVGRNHGVGDAKSHYRKGVSGDWKIYFDRSTMAYFRQLTGDLLEVLRYQE